MNVKKILAASTAAVVVASQALTAVSMAATTTANYPEEWVKAVQFMKENGLSSTANSVEEFQPLATVKREAAAKFFVNFAKKFFNKKPDTTKVCTFSDINEAQAWAVPYIIEACQMGLLKGTNGKFLPKQDLTKLQFLTVLARLVKNNPNIEPVQAFNLMKQEGITKAASIQDTVRPVTRIELAILFMRAAEKYAHQAQEQANSDANSDIGSILGSILGGDEEATQENTGSTEETSATTEETTSEENTETTTTSATTEENVLSVTLNPSTPKQVIAPENGKHVVVAKVDFTAGAEDVTLNNVLVKLNGLINRDDVDSIYFTDENDVVVSNDKKLTTDYTATVTFNNYVIPANTTKTLNLVVDFKADGSRYGYFTIESVDASADIEADLPIRSADIQLVEYTSDTGDYKAYGSGTTEEVYVGDQKVEVYKFQLEDNGSDKKDSIFKSIIIKASGDNVEGRLDNFKIYVGGEDITKTVSVDKDEVTIITKDYVIKDGDSKNFYVYADVVGGEDGDAIQFYVDGDTDTDKNKFDLSQKVVLLSDGAAVPVYADSEGDTYGKTISIKEGDMLITKSSESPTSSYVPTDEDNVTVLVANFNVTSPISVDEFKVPYTLVTSKTGEVIDEIKLFLDDKLVDSITVNLKVNGTYTGAKAVFDYNGDIEKGTHKLVVKVDTAKDAVDGSKIKDVTINKDSFVDAEYVESGNDARDDIKGEARSATFTVKAPALESVARTDGYADGDKIIAGTTDYEIMKFTLQANNVRDLEVNGFDVVLAKDGSGNVLGDKDGLTTIKVVANGQVLDTEDFSDGSATFNGLNVNIPKGGTTELSILLSTTTAYDVDNHPYLQIEAKNFDIEDSKGNTVKTDTTPGIPVKSAKFKVVDTATVYISRDSNTPTERPLAANPNVEYEVARFKFKAVDDDAELQELLLKNVDGSGNLYTGADSVVNKVYLYDVNGNKLGEATLANGKAYFTLSTPYTFKQDQEESIIVKVKTNSIDSEDLSNAYVRFAIEDKDGTQQTKLVSKSNGEEIDLSSATLPTADAQYFRRTIITVSADETNGTLADGTKTLYKFTLTPDSAGDAAVKRFELSYSVNDADGSGELKVTGFKLYINDGKVDDNNVNFNATGGKLYVTLTGSYASGYDLTAGSDTTFEIRADITGSETDDSVTVSLDELSDDMGKYDYNTLKTKNAAIIWSDKAADNTTLSTVDWFTEANLPGVPAASQTLSK